MKITAATGAAVFLFSHHYIPRGRVASQSSMQRRDLLFLALFKLFFSYDVTLKISYKGRAWVMSLHNYVTRANTLDVFQRPILVIERCRLFWSDGTRHR